MEMKIEAYLEMLKQQPEVKQLLETLCAIGNPYVVGGAVRDVLTDKQPKDLDIMLEATILDLTPYLEQFHYVKNRFNGFKLKFQSIDIDIWLMQDHFPFKQNWYSPSIENFVYTPIFNIDAIYYDINQKYLYIQPLIETFQTKELDFQLKEPYLSLIPYTDMNIAKAFVTKEKYDLHFSPCLHSYIREWIDKTPNSYQLIAEKQIRNYGKVVIQIDDIKKTFD